MYIDPNTGGMLFQILAVLFGVISAAILIFSTRIKMFIKKTQRKLRERGKSGAEEATPDEETPPSAI